MGMRGPRATVSSPRANPVSTVDDLIITDAALALYRKMRKLDRQCECLPVEELKKKVRFGRRGYVLHANNGGS